MTYKSGLDPENDPVVYITDYGLEIRYANDFTSSNLAGYTYFTMGNYNGTPINWVIIGYNPTLSDLVGDYSGLINKNPTQGDNDQFSTLDRTPAGSAIMKDMFAISMLAVEHGELDKDSMLCLSECVLYTTVFGSNNIYEGSTLQDEMQSLYESKLNLKDFEKELIKKQTLITNYQNTTCQSDNQYFFPLAGRSEKFNCLSYLIKGNLRYATTLNSTAKSVYWLRSGDTNASWAYHVGNTDEAIIGYGANVSKTMGVRPAFVFQL